MNIHFSNKALYKQLLENSITSIKVGSHLYELNNNNSDDDFLVIYLDGEKNVNSFLWSHHQLQYKDTRENIDYNFTTLRTFIRNIMTGDATINFEALHSYELLHSDLKWLWNFRNKFVGYNLIKSYLGLAKRDLKMWKRETKNGKFVSNETAKKFSHFIRGIIFAKQLIADRALTLNLSTSFYNNFYDTDFELVDCIKNGRLGFNYKVLADFFEDEMNNLRDELNALFENGEINRIMSVEDMKLLDEFLYNYIADKKRVKHIDSLDLYYKVLEDNEVKY